jgi:ribose-phosphate pyrophosphokinase
MAKLIAGSNSLNLAKRVSDISGMQIVNKIIRKFPDGEIYVRLDDAGIEGEDVFIIHTLYPEQNQNLMELFLTIDAAKGSGGKPVLVIPYLAYGRQDRIFQEGEAFSLRAVAKMLKSLGTEKVITIDAHFHRKAGAFDFFGIPAVNTSAVTLQIEYAKKLLKEGFQVVGPDEGSRDFLSGVEGAVFLKKEKRCPECGMEATLCKCGTKEKTYRLKVEVPEELRGKRVFLIDDMVTSGGTIIEAAKALKEKGNKVVVSCTHGLFLGDSLKRLREYAEDVFCTDTIESQVSKVSVSEMIAKEICG